MTPSIYSDSILYRKSRCIQTWIQKRNWHWLCRWLGIRRIQTYISVNSARIDKKMFGDCSLKVDIYELWLVLFCLFDCFDCLFSKWIFLLFEAWVINRTILFAINLTFPLIWEKILKWIVEVFHPSYQK